MYHVVYKSSWFLPLSAFFSLEISNCCWILIHFFLFFRLLLSKSCFNGRYCNFYNFSYWRSPFEKAFWNKDYVIKKKVITWLKLYCWCDHAGKPSVSVREVIATSNLFGFDQKNDFFECWSWFNFNKFVLVLDMTLTFHSSRLKELK